MLMFLCSFPLVGSFQRRSRSPSYRYSHLAYIRQALSYSTKTSIRTDSAGTLSLQFMIVNVSAAPGEEESAGGFVEFTCMPLNED